MIRKALSLSPLLLLLGCPEAPLDAELVGSQQLSVLLAADAPSVVGVTYDHAAGQRLLLEADGDIHALHDDGRSERIATAPRFSDWEEPINGDWTDFAALGNGRYAMTARSDGWLFDANTDSLVRHFCYEPGWMDEELFEQLTHSVTYDPVSDLLYAQPQTYNVSMGDEVLDSAQIGTFGGTTGGDLDWFSLNDAEHLAGGIALDGPDLLLAEGDRLLRWNRESGDLDLVGTLDAFGIGHVDAMVRDPVSDTLLVVDSAADLLLEIRLN